MFDDQSCHVWHPIGDSFSITSLHLYTNKGIIIVFEYQVCGLTVHRKILRYYQLPSASQYSFFAIHRNNTKQN